MSLLGDRAITPPQQPTPPTLGASQDQVEQRFAEEPQRVACKFDELSEDSGLEVSSGASVAIAPAPAAPPAAPVGPAVPTEAAVATLSRWELSSKSSNASGDASDSRDSLQGCWGSVAPVGGRPTPACKPSVGTDDTHVASALYVDSSFEDAVYLLAAEDASWGHRPPASGGYCIQNSHVFYIFKFIYERGF